MNATPTLIETPPRPAASLGALGVAPCSSEGIIEILLRFISPPDFDSATEEVARSVCTNYYQTFNTNCFTAVNPTPTLTCQIMVAYMNAATNGLLPDYEPGMNPYTGKGSPYWFSWNGALAVEQVARLTGYDRKIIAEVLYELYYATASGRIVSTAYAHPRAYAENKGILASVPTNSDLDKNRSLFDLGIGDLVRWGLICGVVIAGTFAVLQLVNTGRTIARGI